MCVRWRARVPLMDVWSRHVRMCRNTEPVCVRVCVCRGPDLTIKVFYLFKVSRPGGEVQAHVKVGEDTCLFENLTEPQHLLRCSLRSVYRILPHVLCFSSWVQFTFRRSPCQRGGSVRLFSVPLERQTRRLGLIWRRRALRLLLSTY